MKCLRQVSNTKSWRRKQIKQTMIIPSLTFTGGGDNKIFDQKVKVEAKSKVGSTDNIKHKAGGGNVKVGGTPAYRVM